MASIDPQVGAQILRSQLDPWHSAIENPSRAQEEVLQRFLKDYAHTEYGHQYRADRVRNAGRLPESFSDH